MSEPAEERKHRARGKKKPTSGLSISSNTFPNTYSASGCPYSLSSSSSSKSEGAPAREEKKLKKDEASAVGFEA